MPFRNNKKCQIIRLKCFTHEASQLGFRDPFTSGFACGNQILSRIQSKSTAVFCWSRPWPMVYHSNRENSPYSMFFRRKVRISLFSEQPRTQSVAWVWFVLPAKDDIEAEAEQCIESQSLRKRNIHFSVGFQFQPPSV